MERVGITTHKRKRNVAPNPAAAAAVAAFLGVTSPALANPRPFNVSALEVRPTEWREMSGDHPTPVIPMHIVDPVSTHVDTSDVTDVSAAAGLKEALTMAAAVRRALPVDDEMDRRVTRALRKRSEGYVPRKL